MAQPDATSPRERDDSLLEARLTDLRDFAKRGELRSFGVHCIQEILDRFKELVASSETAPAFFCAGGNGRCKEQCGLCATQETHAVPSAIVRGAWIPVSERKPPEFVAGMRYLCWFQEREAILEYDPSAGWLWGDGAAMIERVQSEVTHWMELPEAPK